MAYLFNLFFPMVLICGLSFSSVKYHNEKKFNVSVEILKYGLAKYLKVCDDIDKRNCGINLVLKFFNNSTDLKIKPLATHSINFKNRPTIGLVGRVDGRKTYFDHYVFPVLTNMKQSLLVVMAYIYVTHDELKSPKEIVTLYANIQKDGKYEMKLLEDFVEYIAEIDLKVTIACADHFYGKGCSHYCYDAPGYFKCNETGHRQCEPGKMGRLCDQFELHVDRCNSSLDFNPCKCTKQTDLSKGDKTIFWCSRPYTDCVHDSLSGLCSSINEICILDLESLKPSCLRRKLDKAYIHGRNPKPWIQPYVNYIIIGLSAFGLVTSCLLVYNCNKRKRGSKPDGSVYSNISLADSNYDKWNDGLCQRPLPDPLNIQQQLNIHVEDEYVLPKQVYAEIKTSYPAVPPRSPCAVYVNQLELPQRAPRTYAFCSS